MDMEMLKIFKNTLLQNIEKKTSWGKNELKEEIEKAYIELLEDTVEEYT
jgi:hypothetical protein